MVFFSAFLTAFTDKNLLILLYTATRSRLTDHQPATNWLQLLPRNDLLKVTWYVDQTFLFLTIAHWWWKYCKNYSTHSAARLQRSVTELFHNKSLLYPNHHRPSTAASSVWAFSYPEESHFNFLLSSMWFWLRPHDYWSVNWWLVLSVLRKESGMPPCKAADNLPAQGRP